MFQSSHIDTVAQLLGSLKLSISSRRNPTDGRTKSNFTPRAIFLVTIMPRDGIAFNGTQQNVQSTKSKKVTKSTSHFPPSLRRLPSAGLGASFSWHLCGAARGGGSYDSLLCAKGASSALAPALHSHFTELKWAVQHGIPASLVRVNIGLEYTGWLYKMFADALKVAKDAHRAKRMRVGIQQTQRE